jgi:hypothetical protein
MPGKPGCPLIRKWNGKRGPDDFGKTRFKISERVLKIARAVLRRGAVAGFVASQSKIHEGYSPSSRLAIRHAALAIPSPIYFQSTL